MDSASSDHLDLPALALICRRYGLPPPESRTAPWGGATSHVYPCGDVVIKVALDAPHAIMALTIDAAMNPVVRDLGVHAPELLVFDDSRQLLAVPFAIYRQVPGAMPLQSDSVQPHGVRAAWEAVGRDLARIHDVPYGTPMPLPLREFRQSPGVDPRPWVGALRHRGLLSDSDAAWLGRVLSFLEPFAMQDIPLRLCHGDVNAANVLLSPSSETCALIDWAGAGWLDPAWDFVAVSLAVVPYMLSGHRAVRPLPQDDTAEARICWCQAQTRLLNAYSRLDDAGTGEQVSRDVHQLRSFAKAQGWPVLDDE